MQLNILSISKLGPIAEAARQKDNTVAQNVPMM